MKGPTTIVLNGLWGRVLSGVILAAILAGGSGLVVAVRLAGGTEMTEQQMRDHENRIRAIEGSLAKLSAGIEVLLERTRPDR
jgi:hypothetical protein